MISEQDATKAAYILARSIVVCVYERQATFIDIQFQIQPK